MTQYNSLITQLHLHTPLNFGFCGFAKIYASWIKMQKRGEGYKQNYDV